MKPLVHPPLDSVTVEGILHALSDPIRVEIFARIAAAGGAPTCSSFLTVKGRPVPKSTLSTHFKVLRESGLIHSERVGVEMKTTARCAELDTRFPGLIAAIVASLNVQARESAAKRALPKGPPEPKPPRRAKRT